MFCSDCGKPAHGRFCSHCGHPLVIAAERIADQATDARRIDSLHDQVRAPLGHNWHEEFHYQNLLAHPQVREHLARHATHAGKSLSSEEFLSIADLAFEPMIGVSLSKVGSIVLPIYTRMGIKTGKQQEATFAHPIGKTIVAALCSLSQTGHPLKRVHQAADGCVLEATLPSDLWSWEGELVVSITRQAQACHLEAATKIPGQLYDWGKSKKHLESVFQQLGAILQTIG